MTSKKSGDEEVAAKAAATKQSADSSDDETADREAKVDLAASVAWTPSARGEPGKTPRDLAFGPLELDSYCTEPQRAIRPRQSHTRRSIDSETYA